MAFLPNFEKNLIEHGIACMSHHLLGCKQLLALAHALSSVNKLSEEDTLYCGEDILINVAKFHTSLTLVDHDGEWKYIPHNPIYYTPITKKTFNLPSLFPAYHPRYSLQPDHTDNSPTLQSLTDFSIIKGDIKNSIAQASQDIPSKQKKSICLLTDRYKDKVATDSFDFRNTFIPLLNAWVKNQLPDSPGLQLLSKTILFKGLCMMNHYAESLIKEILDTLLGDTLSPSAIQTPAIELWQIALTYYVYPPEIQEKITTEICPFLSQFDTGIEIFQTRLVAEPILDPNLDQNKRDYRDHCQEEFSEYLAFIMYIELDTDLGFPLEVLDCFDRCMINLSDDKTQDIEVRRINMRDTLSEDSCKNIPPVQAAPLILKIPIFSRLTDKR